MKAKLISKEHGDFVFDRTATIGRAEGCTVTLDASVVSNEHARISFDADHAAYVLEDLGSLNGTQLDGVSIERKEVLGKLNLVCFGGSEIFIFQLLNAEGGPELETIDLPVVGETEVDVEIPELPTALRDKAGKASSAPDAAQGAGPAATNDGAGTASPEDTRIEKDMVPVPEVLAEASAVVTARGPGETELFLELALDDDSQRFPLQEGENTVGRSKASDIRLDLEDLSRRHAVLTVKEGRVLLRDEGSRNHTYVEGELVEQEVEIQVGARIVLGRVEARLMASAPKKEKS